MRPGHWLYTIPLRFRSLFRRAQADLELDNELRDHLERKTEEYIARGMAPEEARLRARLDLGGMEKVKQECRDARSVNWIQDLVQDFRYGLRVLRKSPVFTAVAVLTLALGIGANTAIFSVENSLFQRGLPAPDPGRLLAVSFRQSPNLWQHNFSYPDFEDIGQQATCFSQLFAYRIGLDGLEAGERAEQVITSFVTGNYFSSLGLEPALGRLILPTEGTVPGSDPVLVLGYSYWQERFGGDRDIVGKQVEVDGHPLTVVGVAPKGFRGLYGGAIDVQAYLPINMFSVEQRNGGWATDRASRSLYVMGRLKPGASPDQAQASLDVIAARLLKQYPKDWQGSTIETLPSEAANALYDPSRHSYRVARLAAGLFLAMAALVLLIACFNVANLLLARATAREHEMAVRAALGASRSRLRRQVFAETVLLAILGGSAGIAAGSVTAAMLSSIRLHVAIPVRLDFSFDWQVFLFALACAALAGIVVGPLPAARASRADAIDSLRSGPRNIAPGRQYFRNLLVVGQLAISLILLVVAGLFVRSFQKATELDLGFDPRHVLNISIEPGQLGYDHNRGRALYKDLLARVRTLSGVQAASLAFTFPGSEYAENERVYVEGHLAPPGQAGPFISDNSVSPGYFKTMGIPIVEGRGFQETDTQSAPRVAIVNQTMAREFWPDEDPIGRRFKLAVDSDAWIQIVGVARDSRVQDLTAKVSPYFYLPLDQDYCQLVTLQVRTLDTPEAMARGIEEQVQILAPGLPVFGVQTMEQALNSPNGFFHYWLGSVLASVLGFSGLLLAVVGVYGVVSYSANQRTHEIGVRIAIGAPKGEVLRLVVGQGLKLALIGAAMGILGALGLTRFLSNLLYGVTPIDPLTFVVVTMILVGTAGFASYLPARRATRVDPMAALRYE